MSTQGDEVRRVVHEEIAESRSWRKNGGSWWSWFARIMCPDRAIPLATAAMIFGAGGCWFKVVRDSTEALNTSQVVLERERKLADNFTSIAHRIDALAAVVNGYGQNESARASRLQQELDEMKRQIQRSVTRGEFSEGVWQNIVPRLDRIERRLRLEPDDDGK